MLKELCGAKLARVFESASTWDIFYNIYLKPA
jgi:hypothetical protein